LAAIRSYWGKNICVKKISKT